MKTSTIRSTSLWYRITIVLTKSMPTDDTSTAPPDETHRKESIEQTTDTISLVTTESSNTHTHSSASLPTTNPPSTAHSTTSTSTPTPESTTTTPTTKYSSTPLITTHSSATILTKSTRLAKTLARRTTRHYQSTTKRRPYLWTHATSHRRDVYTIYKSKY